MFQTGYMQNVPCKCYTAAGAKCVHGNVNYPLTTGWITPPSGATTTTYTPPCQSCLSFSAVVKDLARDCADAEADADFLRDTLAAVLDYVRWSDMPEALSDDIDAALDGNA